MTLWTKRLVRPFATTWGLAVCLGAAGLLMAQEEEAEKAAEKAVEKTEEAAEQAGEAAKKAAEEVKDEAEEAAGPEAALLVTNLDNPCGLALHGPSGDVFIATHVGVYRYSPTETDRSKKIHLHIAEFPTDTYGMGPTYEIGPLGLAFWGDDRLVVGGGSRPDGQELVHIFKLEEEKEIPHPPIKEENAEFTLGPIEPSDQTVKGEGNFYSVAVGENAIYFSTNGDDTKGWVARIPIQDGKPGDIELHIATKQKTEVDAPVPVIMSPDKKELVIGQMGEINVPNDSLLTTYDPESGELKKKYSTPLHDIAGLAYSPKTGKLYATDFAWMDPAQGALYRLDVEGDEVNAEKVMSLDKPTALTFDKDGNLYVTIFGTATEEMTENDKSPGQLLRIPAEDLE